MVLRKFVARPLPWAVVVCALVPLLGLTSCESPTGQAENTHLPFNPCCALVIAENPPGGPSGLLISQRRGAPNDDRWELLGPHHMPQYAPSIPVGTPEFAWHYLDDVKEVALPLGGDRYQVHVLVATDLKDTRGFLESGVFADMIQDATKIWRPVRVAL